MSVARKVNVCCKCLNSICAKTSVSLMCTVKQAVLSRGWSRGCIWISSWLSVLNKCSECEKHRCFLSFPIHSARYRLFIDDNYEISRWKMMCYAWDRIVLVTEIASKILSLLLRNMPIFKAIDSKKHGDFCKTDCKLLTGTVLLWNLENGDISCFQYESSSDSLTIIRRMLLRWCVVYSNLGLAHVWLTSPAFSSGICISQDSGLQGTQPPVSCDVWEAWDQISANSSSHCQSFLMWRCQTVPSSWDPTWTFPLSAVKVHLRGRRVRGSQNVSQKDADL